MLYDGAFSGWLMKRMGRTRDGEIEREGMGDGWSWQIVWGFFKTTQGDRWRQCVSFIISDPLFNQRQRKTATVQRTGLQDKVSSHHHSNTYAHTYLLKHSPLPLKRPHTHWWDDPQTGYALLPLRTQRKGAIHAGAMVTTPWQVEFRERWCWWCHQPSGRSVAPVITSCLFPSPFKVCPVFTQLSFFSLLSTLRSALWETSSDVSVETSQCSLWFKTVVF